MKYVYILRSINHAGQRYFGITSDLRRRFADHNVGRTSHTAKFRPWTIETYVAFSDEHRTEEFEKYLKRIWERVL